MVEQEEERRGGEDQATDIKSNNPHLAGGEKQNIEISRIIYYSCYIIIDHKLYYINYN